jgi:hypothetical protein
VTGGLLIGHFGTPVPQNNSQKPQNPPRPGQRVAAGVMRIEFLRRIERELNLSPEQKQKVDAILSDGQERTRQIMEPLTPQIRQELNKALAEFRAELTPPQQARFDEMIKQAQHPPQHRSGEKREHMPEETPPPAGALEKQ